MAKGQITPEQRLAQNFARLKTTNLRLRTKVTEQDKVIAEQHAAIETFKIQIAELQTMVFGKKRKPPTGHHVPEATTETALPCSKSSYRRHCHQLQPLRVSYQ